MNEIMAINSGDYPLPALYSFDAACMPVKQYRGNYLVSPVGGAEFQLTRNTDFGVIPGTKQPSLYKSGAEKVCMSLGLCQHYTMESKIEDTENGVFFYTVRCDLVKIINGSEYVITTSYGSGNTREKRCGRQSPFDGANSALKMAQKRALVGAAISLGGLSSAFTQDLENETFLEDAESLFKGNPDDAITAKQVKYFYTITSRNGLTKQQSKAFLLDNGYNSAKEILNKDFDRLCEEAVKIGDKNNADN